MNIKLIVSITLLAFVASCNQENKVEKLKTEVMTIHDEVMPKMGRLMNLKKQLKDKIARLDSIGDNTEELVQLIHNLEGADEAMMEWMRSYKEPTPEMSEEEALKYLQDRMESIRKVKQKINSSKVAAETVLNQKNSHQ